MSMYCGLLLVAFMVGVVSVADNDGPTLAKDSGNITFGSTKNKGGEKVLNRTTSSILDGSINSDGKLGTQSFIQENTFPTPLSEIVDTLAQHDTTVSVKEVHAAPVLSNRTLNEQTKFIELSSVPDDASFTNESQVENQEAVVHLPIRTDEISNVSFLTNHTNYTADSNQYTCSMIQKMKFIFMIGRKMPLYLDIISLVIGAIGIVGNLATVAIVTINIKLKKPYFLTILTLAVADLFGVCFMIFPMFFEFEFPIYYKCIKPAFYVLISTCIWAQANAILQVVLIALIKFLLLVYPIQSRSYVTNNLIVVLFFVILSVSACYAYLGCYAIMQKVKVNEDTSAIMIFLILSFTVPLILVIIILHFIKVAKLSKSQALRKEVRKMNKVVSIILAIFLVYNFIKIGTRITFMLTWNAQILQILHKIITVAAFVQHASNPIIYAAFTPLVQRPWERLKEKFAKR